MKKGNAKERNAKHVTLKSKENHETRNRENKNATLQNATWQHTSRWSQHDSLQHDSRHYWRKDCDCLHWERIQSNITKCRTLYFRQINIGMDVWTETTSKIQVKDWTRTQRDRKSMWVTALFFTFAKSIKWSRWYDSTAVILQMILLNLLTIFFSILLPGIGARYRKRTGWQRSRSMQRRWRTSKKKEISTRRNSNDWSYGLRSASNVSSKASSKTPIRSENQDTCQTWRTISMIPLKTEIMK